MSEFFASIKAFIEKGNIIIFLLAAAFAIFTYKVLSSEMLWAIFSFCVAYALFYGINILYNRYWTLRALEGEEKRRIESEKLAKEQTEKKAQYDKEQREARLRTLYESLPDDVKEGLILLYKLPQPDGGFTNSRIIKDGIEDIDKIQNAYHQVRIFLNLENLIEVTNSIKSTIVTIAPDFYNIIEEKEKAR